MVLLYFIIGLWTIVLLFGTIVIINRVFNKLSLEGYSIMLVFVLIFLIASIGRTVYDLIVPIV